MKDKKENFEWAQRGCDLENIHKVLESHKAQLLMHTKTALCYRQIRVLLDEYMERCTPKPTKHEQRRYVDNKAALLKIEGHGDEK